MILLNLLILMIISYHNNRKCLLACSIKDFELTPELAIFDSLNIPLYHGWIVHPQVHHFDCFFASICSNRKVSILISFPLLIYRIWKLLLQLEADLIML